MQKDNLDFKEAFELCNKNLSHEDLIKFLQTGNVIERQYSALSLDFLTSKLEAEILMSNLVGVDGKIREAAALKIAELTKSMPEFFLSEYCFDKISKATIDIDGNVCRLAIESAKNLSFDANFSNYYTDEIIRAINESLVEISKFTFRDKKYKINKQVFKIYWCLDALEIFYEYADSYKLLKLLKSCSELHEYTIREKCAKILINFKLDESALKLLENLKNDENYYVRSVLNN